MNTEKLEPQDFENERHEIEKHFFIAIVLLFAILLITIFAGETDAQEKEQFDFSTSVMEVENYVTWFHRNVREDRWARAIKIVPVAVEESIKQDFDPLLVATIITGESGWRPDVISEDGHNTIGLMQVKPCGVCGKGYNLRTVQGQIQAGVMCLKMSRERCDGELNQTLTMYASGKCVSKSKRTRRLIKKRIRLYMEAVEVFRAD